MWKLAVAAASRQQVLMVYRSVLELGMLPI